MFSYLILCPSKGSSLICLAWPCSCHCSTASLVQLMIPGAACHTRFSLDQFQLIFQCCSSEAYTSFLFPFVLLSFSFSNFKFLCCFVLPVFMEALEENLSWLPLFGLEWENYKNKKFFFKFTRQCHV